MAQASLLQRTIAKLVGDEHLTRDEARGAMAATLDGQGTDAQLGALFVALRMKGETPAELAGFAQAIRERAVRIPTTREDVIDTSGSGGGQVRTFSVSTAAAIVAAGADVPVAKQVSGPMAGECGSAAALRELGVRIDVSPDTMARCLDEVGLAFLYSPSLHPAMRHLLKPRAELGVSTVFNILGPLCNPLGLRRQLIGASDAQYTELLATALQLLGVDHVLVVHAMVGMDELSTCGDTQVTEVHSGDVHSALWSPEQYGLEQLPECSYSSGAPEECANAVNAVLNKEGGADRDLVVFNAGAAIYVGGKAADMQEGIIIAQESIDSGAAAAKLAAVREIAREG